MKFGKYLEGRQLELSEYNGHFIDYKGLKKLIKQLAIPVFPSGEPNSTDLSIDQNKTKIDDDDNDDDVTDFNNPVFYHRLQENKASFFFRLERELEKVNSFYLEKEADLRVQFNILQSKYNNYKKNGRLSSRIAISFKTIYGGFIKFQKDLSNFEQFVELNKTGFSKVLKKWDKRSHSQEKEFYLATVVSVQPIFARNEALKLNDETLNILIELNDVNNNNETNDSKQPLEHIDNDSVQNIKYQSNQTDLRDIQGSKLTQTLNVLNLKPVNNHGIVNYSTNPLEYFDCDTKIENWYIELINIAKLKDDDRRHNTLTNFTVTKIEQSINSSNLSDKATLLTKCISRLFLLLISSTIDDISLKVFYEASKSNIDLLYSGNDEEEFTKRSIMHEAMHSSAQPRTFIIQLCMDTLDLDTLRHLINGQDIYLRTPLHYAAELGKLDSIKLIISSTLVMTIDEVDNNSKSPLILSIINNHNDIVEFLLIFGGASVVPKFTEQMGPQFSPLCVACKYNNLKATQLLLKLRSERKIGLKDPSDPEAAEALHIVAKNGGDSKLISALISYGANPNGIDNFNKWTPIFYAIQKGNAASAEMLLNNGARLDVTDEDGKSPLFYTLWDSHIGVLNAILPFINQLDKQKPIAQIGLTPMQNNDLPDDLDELDGSLEHIPDFELPPPIIPLRKYGHNFLEKKIFIKLVFKEGEKCIHFNNNDTLELTQPGRMTITSNLSDIVPRNIIFSVGENSDYDESKTNSYEATFLIDTLDNFSIDFEIFASFGTRLLAKTTAMSHFFTNDLVSSMRDITLSLFDHRLNCVGSLELQYQVILPYLAKPLQITKYEPYWKSTGNNNSNNNNNNIPGIMGLDNQGAVSKNAFNSVQSTIVTSSSLAGVFISIKVFALNDGTIVASPNFYVDIHGTNILINDLSKPQLEKLCGYNIDEIENDICNTIGYDDEKIIGFFKTLISSKIFQFDTLLKAIPKSIQLVVQVCFPTLEEIQNTPVKISPYVTINKFIDDILYIIFEHERTLRHSGQSIRSIVFSSCNWQACSILNWKQPNFPVLLRMNTLSKSGNLFIGDTPHRLKSVTIQRNAIDIPIYDENNTDTNQITDQSSNNMIADDNNPISIHDMVRFAISNNLLGVIIPYELLRLCETLNSVIKGQELLLIGSSQDSNDLMKEDKEINGRYYDAELIFN
ncbi:similar to Saccharomyces cerevisiae YGR233C PHO81 Cyclin-dependent kinase (CDK) inhibitor, regulates Pho80p-Pho85p and Pcl7p-Pho85p cyclin-CDK complexes in response to phosphate levels [Maudiozyma saulgeensis]|uniref:Similar to Saccharomyces cerevisiae YGR233C PHO81 Cyclin-dependent kinase (CDK) inhibitor, regulates Pho80p-Pho85p and Pcl7p-Pho85p cyclin-CDK complexes in response to phosphate levels n=1 Tax=Maudiozyma saulgeensis TaxID=1789683 RepID=A0A1X7R9Q4_9SACH|nr:similar to Saccharomyces cerevisiae YGR233C PHO81 Cyclin-dependent kinase (CDK) inhibitor, regulates Pho80p-Pho85p and Pcl7p-Pho85p cyclin-CDK complexes in response to phosphate levels [Kazachstania saulgeensis]